MNRILTLSQLNAFRDNLICEEKSAATIQKYLRDVRAFIAFAGGGHVTKEVVVAYKSAQEKKYAVRSVNSMLAALNSFFGFLGWAECKVKFLRCQQQAFCPSERELTKAEYLRLLQESEKQTQLNLLLQTVCATGIRISELPYFTVAAMQKGEVIIRCKSKTRRILVPGKLRALLLKYARRKGITEGPIFVSRNGNPLDRSNIWHRMKRLCAAAGVNPAKVFPHNLRKLFARTFYEAEKDIAKLADILGHTNINTTRIYIVTTGIEHLRKLERLGLVFPPISVKKERTT